MSLLRTRPKSAPLLRQIFCAIPPGSTGVKPMDTELNVSPEAGDYEKNIVCPYCGYVDRDSYERSDEDTVECHTPPPTFPWHRHRFLLKHPASGIFHPPCPDGLRRCTILPTGPSSGWMKRAIPSSGLSTPPLTFTGPCFSVKYFAQFLQGQRVIGRCIRVGAENGGYDPRLRVHDQPEVLPINRL